MCLPGPLSNSGPKAIVVAHPDDETMWAGALPLMVPGEWTVICCSIPRRDPERAWHFYSACRVLGATGYVLPYTETEGHTPLSLRALELIDLSPYVCVVTHNAEGEYGHLHHRGVHKFVKERAVGRMVCFGFGSKVANQFALSIGHAEWRTKMRALQCYTSGDPLKVKWQALLERYGPMGYDTRAEAYHEPE